MSWKQNVCLSSTFFCSYKNLRFARTGIAFDSVKNKILSQLPQELPSHKQKDELLSRKDTFVPFAGLAVLPLHKQKAKACPATVAQKRQQKVSLVSNPSACAGAKNKVSASASGSQALSLEQQKKKNKEIKRFFNQCFDKGRLKNFVLWFLLNYGENKTVRLVEQLKNIGFQYASKAGISLGIEDLKIPPKKSELIFLAEKETSMTVNQYIRGEITGVERFQRLIDTWHRTSEVLKQEVIDHFEKTDILNPVYMMAFSGARGNISQVRQLVGMRGLMADPQGQIIDFPIRSNFREGLTLTEYVISSYGARKGIVDTALRTANAGYLTRRLVDVAQHVIVTNFDCRTKRGIFLTNMKEGNKTIYSLSQKLVGRVLARDLITVEKKKLASRNEEITSELAFEISKKFDKVFVRSSLTCEKLLCQLCYGWSLAQGKLVSIGEAVGVVAAQSIGEPGTQLTMRTFHTGGVFSGDVSDQIKAPFDGIVVYNTAIPGTLIRTPEGKIAFLTKGEGSFFCLRARNEITNDSYESTTRSQFKTNMTLAGTKTKLAPDEKIFKIPPYTLLYMRNGQNVFEKEVIAQISSISQKTNKTDDAELTIKSEIEGQFYSKSLTLREKVVGWVPPEFDTMLGQSSLTEQSFPIGDLLAFPSESKKNIATATRDSKVADLDMVYEAWTWGYAWILSGKIYNFKKPSPSFPIVGDYLNTKSYMTQTHWSLSKNNGSSVSFDFVKRKPHGSLSLKNNGRFSNLNKIKTYKKNDSNNFNNFLPNQTTQILLLNLKKITFKKSGYALELSKKVQFLSNNGCMLKNSRTDFFDNQRLSNNSHASHVKHASHVTSASLKNGFFKEKDFLFFIQPSNNKESFSSIKNENLSKKSLNKLSYFLQWFPYKYKTNTGGLFIFENPYKKNFFNYNSNIYSSSNLFYNANLQNRKQSVAGINQENIYSKHLTRYSFLKQREIFNSKILWIPYNVFKFSKKDLGSLFTWKQDSHRVSKVNNKKEKNEQLFAQGLNFKKSFSSNTGKEQIFSLFLTNKTSFSQINRQSCFSLSNFLYMQKASFLKIKKYTKTLNVASPFISEKINSAPFYSNAFTSNLGTVALSQHKTSFQQGGIPFTSAKGKKQATNQTQKQEKNIKLDQLYILQAKQLSYFYTEKKNHFVFLISKNRKKEINNVIEQKQNLLLLQLLMREYQNFFVTQENKHTRVEQQNDLLLKASLNQSLTLKSFCKTIEYFNTCNLLASVKNIQSSVSLTVNSLQNLNNNNKQKKLENEYLYSNLMFVYRATFFLKCIKKQIKYVTTSLFLEKNYEKFTLLTSATIALPNSSATAAGKELLYSSEQRGQAKASSYLNKNEKLSLVNENKSNFFAFLYGEKAKYNFKNIYSFKARFNTCSTFEDFAQIFKQASFFFSLNSFFRSLAKQTNKVQLLKVIYKFLFKIQSIQKFLFNNTSMLFSTPLKTRRDLANYNTFSFNMSKNVGKKEQQLLAQSNKIKEEICYYVKEKRGWVYFPTRPVTHLLPYSNSFGFKQTSNITKDILSNKISLVNYKKNNKDSQPFDFAGSYKTKKVSYFNSLFRYNKKTLLAGQNIFKDISFNIPIYIESLLLNDIFNIEKISSLSFFKENKQESAEKQNLNKVYWVKNKKLRYSFNLNINNNNVVDIDNSSSQNNFGPTFASAKAQLGSFLLDTKVSSAGKQVHLKNQENEFLQAKLGFLFQPIQEFEKMSNLELKNYVSDYNKYPLKNTILNFASLKRQNSFTLSFSSPTAQAMHFSAKGKQLIKKLTRKNKKGGPFKLKNNKKAYERTLFNIKKKRKIFVNKSFDSLSKMQLHKSEINSKKPFLIKPSASLGKHLRVYKVPLAGHLSACAQEKALLFSFLNTKSSFLNKNLFYKQYQYISYTSKQSYFKFFIQKKNTRMLKEGSLYNKIVPKLPKEDFTIVPNMLTFSSGNQPQNKLKDKKVPLAGHLSAYAQDRNIINCRKSFNVFPFMISHKQMLNLPMSFSETQKFKFSHQPLYSFDNLLHPNLSTEIIKILNFYISLSSGKHSHSILLPVSTKKQKRETWETVALSSSSATSLFLTESSIAFDSVSNKEVKGSHKGSPDRLRAFPSERIASAHAQVTEKQTNGLSVTYLMNNVFESPCFSFSLVQPLNLAPFKKDKMQITKFLYSSDHSYNRTGFAEFLSPALFPSELKRLGDPQFDNQRLSNNSFVYRRYTNNSHASHVKGEPFGVQVSSKGKIKPFALTKERIRGELLKELSNSENGVKNTISKTKLKTLERVQAQTNYYSPFTGEMVYTQKTQKLSLLLEKEKKIVLDSSQKSKAFVEAKDVEKQEKSSLFKSTLKSALKYKNRKVPLAGNLSASAQEEKVISLHHSCMFLTKKDLISYYLPNVFSKSTSFLNNIAIRTLALPNELQEHSNHNHMTNPLNSKNTNGDLLNPVDKKEQKPFYVIKDTIVQFLNMTESQSEQLSNNISFITLNKQELIDTSNTVLTISNTQAGKPIFKNSPFRKSNYMKKKRVITKTKRKKQASLSIFKEGIKNQEFKQLSQDKPSLQQRQTFISFLGDFYVYGDAIGINWPLKNEMPNYYTPAKLVHEKESPLEKEIAVNSLAKAVKASGKIIHYNNVKITLRRAQPIFISPKAILHKADGDFIDPKSPVITLSYQRLKAGDIIQGIPKVEQFFEARTTKRGRLFRDSLPSLLKALFKRYQSKFPLEVAVRQSFYKIQQIIVDGVQRVYKSQGVTISDKHLEVIVKQMTSKVRIIDGAQTGFFPGEVVELSFVEKINSFLIKKITYEPLVLGITKASLEVDSFLSASSFQQTTRVLSQAAIYRKKDFLKGLKENVILGNLIPAGTGYLVYLDDVLS